MAGLFTPINMTPEGEKKLIDSVARIEQGMFGDEQLGQPGLIKRVSNVEKWQGSWTIRIARFTGGIAVIFILAKYAFDWVNLHAK